MDGSTQAKFKQTTDCLVTCKLTQSQNHKRYTSSRRMANNFSRKSVFPRSVQCRVFYSLSYISDNGLPKARKETKTALVKSQKLKEPFDFTVDRPARLAFLISAGHDPLDQL